MQGKIKKSRTLSGTCYLLQKEIYFPFVAVFLDTAFLGAAFFATAFLGAAAFFTAAFLVVGADLFAVAFLGAAFFAVAMFLEFNS
jgi:hypothetical protein